MSYFGECQPNPCLQHVLLKKTKTNTCQLMPCHSVMMTYLKLLSLAAQADNLRGHSQAWPPTKGIHVFPPPVKPIMSAQGLPKSRVDPAEAQAIKHGSHAMVTIFKCKVCHFPRHPDLDIQQWSGRFSLQWNFLQKFLWIHQDLIEGLVRETAPQQ